jgi:hypothetical protein
MKTLFSLSLAVLLAVGGIVPAWSHHTPLPGGLDDKSCEQDMKALAPHSHGEHVTVATVIQVDHQLGLLHLETDIGRLLTFVAPEEIKDVQEGDQLVVCLAETDPAAPPPDAIPASPSRSTRDWSLVLLPASLWHSLD